MACNGNTRARWGNYVGYIGIMGYVSSSSTPWNCPRESGIGIGILVEDCFCGESHRDP